MSRSVARPCFVVALAASLLVAACGSTPTPAPGSTAAPSAPAVAAASSAPTTGASNGAAPSSSPAPSPSKTARPSPTPKPTPRPTPNPASLRLASPAFAAGASIPAAYTCDGADASPALSWTGVPAGTKALVLLVTDPDAGGFAHWIVTDIPATTAGLARGAGAAASAFTQGSNDFGRVGWGGPCPPSGTHHYVFTLDALAKPLGLAGHPRIGAVRAALDRARVLGTATLRGTYARP